MPSVPITVRPYDGAIETISLTGRTRLSPSALGRSRVGILSDPIGADRFARFDDRTATFLASGRIEPVLLMIGRGDAFPVVAFTTGDQLWIGFPDGQPDLRKAVSLDLTLGPRALIDPALAGLAQGTRIRTPCGDPRIENLRRGDIVVDAQNQRHTIHWIGQRETVIPVALSKEFSAWLPQRIAPCALAEAQPYDDLVLTPRHRILLDGDHVLQTTGRPSALVRTAHIPPGLARPVHEARSFVSYHILCDRQILLVANGLAVESLLPGDVLAEGAGRLPDDPLMDLFPQLSTVSIKAGNCRPVAPIVDRNALADLLEGPKRSLLSPDDPLFHWQKAG